MNARCASPLFVCVAIACTAPPTHGTDAGPNTDAGIDTVADVSSLPDLGLDVGTAGPVDPSPVVALAASDDHTCALHASGAVYCWGGNDGEELGVGGPTTIPYPVRVPGVFDAVAIAATVGGACIVRASGGVVCWGGCSTATPQNILPFDCDSDFAGPSGPNEIGGISNATAIAGGNAVGSVCALAAGRWTCWGMGFSAAFPYDAGHIQPTTFAGLPGQPPLSSLALPAFSACGVVTQDAGVICWGGAGPANLAGTQNGLSPTQPAFPIPALAPASQISCGGGECCTITQQGSVQCWGDPGSVLVPPQLQPPPGQPASLWLPGAATSIIVAPTFACANVAGSLICWGDDSHGQLGAGVSVDAGATSTTVVALDGPLARFACGGGHACAQTGPHHVTCWGENDHGELGNGAVGEMGVSYAAGTVIGY